MSRNGPERRSDTWYLAGTRVPVLIVKSAGTLCIERFGGICNGPEKVIQNFAEEETRNFPEIVKTGHFEIFLKRSGASEFTYTPLVAAHQADVRGPPEVLRLMLMKCSSYNIKQAGH